MLIESFSILVWFKASPLYRNSQGMFSLQLDFKDLATLFDSHRCIITFYWFAQMNAEVEGSWETLIMESVKYIMPWVEVNA